MAKLFSDDFPAISSQEQLDEVIRKYPHYDPYYVVSGSIPERRIKFEKLFALFQSHSDSHFLDQIKYQFHQRTWEMYLGCSLLARNIDFKSNDEGPDFLLEKDGHRTWIECVACTTGEGPDRVPPMLYGSAQSIPEEEMAIRIASALRNKFNRYKEQLGKTISEKDSYIIAINSGALPFPDGPFPLILRCLFGVGYMTITMPRDGSPSKHFWSRIFMLKKKNGSEVPMDFFLKSEHSGISGVLYCSRTVLNHADSWGDDVFGVNNALANQEYPLSLKKAFMGHYCTLSDPDLSLTAKSYS